VGAILAILFGWFARREIQQSGGRRHGYALATFGMALGLVLTPAWGGAMSYLASTRRPHPEPVASTEPTRPPPDPPSPSPPATPASPDPLGPQLFAPPRTRVTREGRITVVDLGKATPSLNDELAKQRAEASAAGEMPVVMTTAGRCDPCRGVDRSLADPLMQTALARVRLIRVDATTFQEDLATLRMPSSRVPGFYLLAPDLTPRDGIDGGEWDDDVASNIAPVLGAFVRGKYSARRQPWTPVPAGGVAL
jgi:hypothetical protein